MGVQAGPIKKKSKVEQLEDKIRGMQMHLDKLTQQERGAHADTEDCCSDTERGGGGGGAASRPKKVAAAHRRDRQRREPTVSDDDEEIPGWVLKAEGTGPTTEAGSGSATVPKPPLMGLKRKQTFATSQLSNPSDSDSVESTLGRGQRKRASKRVRVDSGEPDTNRGAAQVSSSAPQKKPTRPPPKFKPSSGKPLPAPQWTTPPGELSKTFKLPTSSLKPNAIQKATVDSPSKGPRKGSAKVGQSQDEVSAPVEPSYAEIEAFEFKAVVSYSDDRIDQYYQSTDLQNTMITFWSRLKKLRHSWKEAAGAEWAWELQKAKSLARGRRSCVSSKLAKKPTLWRKGDTGKYACRNCVKNGSLCFTWVAEEDGGEGDHDEEAVIPEPKGEFWCLPIHPVDRGREVRPDREIHTWLNEEDSSESDSSGEEIGESSDEEDFKVGSDYGDISKSESSSEEEDNAMQSDEDDEL